MTKTPVVLFRKDRDNEEEFNICSNYFPTYQYRSDIPQDSLVICRYSCLPFYKELEYDVENKNSVLVNSYSQHDHVASFDWYFSNEEIHEYTPKTWYDWQIPDVKFEGPYVVKGLTNSRKFNWDTHMYAKDRLALSDVMRNLYNDPLIGPQGLIVREYTPLKTFEVGINGLPFTNEWRLFYYDRTLLAFNYYWTGLDNKSSIDNTSIPDMLFFANNVARIISKNIPFFSIDVAEKEDGTWTLIEVNDAQMAGLSMIKPDILYKNLQFYLKNEGRYVK